MLAITAYSACRTEKCHEEYFDYSLNAKILLQDKNTGESLIGPYGKRYDSDLGIFLTDSQMNDVPLIFLNDVLSFNIELDNNLEVDEIIEVVYFLDLPPWENDRNRDLDTLRFELTVSEIDSECFSFEFGMMQYYFNGKLSFSGNPNLQEPGEDYLVSEK
jgi:hypothetical protein